MSKVDPIIRTKLRPPFIRPSLVSRPRLQERVLAGTKFPLTLVIAPAGFGKTTLVASSLAGCPMPIAWLSLDPSDNQIGRFLGYLLAAIQEVDTSIGREAAQLASALQSTVPEAVLTSLINDLDACGGEIALVLDDYQFINNREVHAAVAFLIEHCPKTFHLLIATRSDPPLPLSRLMAHGKIVELRGEDLSFDTDEAERFFREVMELRLSAEQVAVLEDRTEGWVAGLQMAALTMRGRQDIEGFIRAFTGTNRYIMEFMLEEVLANEPEAVQSFLLQTSILTRLNGALCTAVTGDSSGQQMLESLERSNLFLVSLDNDRQWYRYHHLFADLLQARQRQFNPGLIPQLLGRAADWCDQQGYPSEAVNYALTARDYVRAANLIAKYWSSLVNTGEIEVVWSWLNALPPDVVQGNAELGIAYCWVLWLKDQVGQIEQHLPDAEKAVSDLLQQADSTSIDEKYILLPAMIAILRSIVARHHEEFETAISVGESALDLLPPDLPPVVGGTLRTLIFLALASAYDGSGDLQKAANAYVEAIRGSRMAGNPGGLTGMTYRMILTLLPLGRLEEAAAACRDAFEYIQAHGMGRLPVAGLLHVAMSEICVERNDLASAEEHLARGFELAKWSGRYDAVRNAPRPLARLRLAQGDIAGAMTAVEEAEKAQSDVTPPQMKAALLALKVRILISQGLVDQAFKKAEEAVRLAGKDRGQIYLSTILALFRARLARNEELTEVIEALSRVLSAAELSGWKGSALDLLIQRSLAFARSGDSGAAEADLERGLTLARPEGYVRIFLEEGQPLKMLLARWLAHNNNGSQREYAIHLLAQFEEETPTAAVQEKTTGTAKLNGPLTIRELEVLHLLSVGTTNQDIAAQLFVSAGTVKAHTASIYRKLDVANRTEAVSRARQLGILP